MLLKLKNHEVRDNIILKRKLLKGTPYSIHEDLTALNVQLMTRLRNHEHVTQTWSWNGKVFAILDNDKTIIVTIWPDIREMANFSLGDRVGSRSLFLLHFLGYSIPNFEIRSLSTFTDDEAGSIFGLIDEAMAVRYMAMYSRRTNL